MGQHASVSAVSHGPGPTFPARFISRRRGRRCALIFTHKMAVTRQNGSRTRHFVSRRDLHAAQTDIPVYGGKYDRFTLKRPSSTGQPSLQRECFVRFLEDRRSILLGAKNQVALRSRRRRGDGY